MAKSSQQLSFWDLHLEKLVLAGALLFLVWAVARWGLSSPQTFQVRDKQGRETQVQADRADRAIQEYIQTVYEKINKYRPEAPTPPKFDDILKKMLDHPLPEGLQQLATGTPLNKGSFVLAPTAPGFASNLDAFRKGLGKPPAPQARAMIELPDQTGALKEVPTFRAAGWYDLNGLKSRWLPLLAKTPIAPRPFCMGREFQIEEQINGAWRKVPVKEQRRTPGEKDITPPATSIPNFDGSNSEAITTAMGIFGKSKRLEYELQPAYWDIWTQTGKIPWWDTESSFPRELWGNFAQAVRAPAGPEGATEAPAVVQQVPTAMPSFEHQGKLNRYLAWIHNTGIRYNRPYRCRVRWTFLNPLLAQKEEFLDEGNKQDNQPAILTSDWSDWSQPVSIGRKVEFFLTGSHPATGELTVTVFTQYLLQWVRTPFRGIRPGKSIGGSATVSLVDPATGVKVQREVDFNTGAVSIEQNYSVQVETQAGFERNTEELTYLDSDGKLKSRTRYFDGNCHRLKELEKLASQSFKFDSTPDPAHTPPGPRPRAVIRTPRDPKQPGPSETPSPGDEEISDEDAAERYRQEQIRKEREARKKNGG